MDAERTARMTATEVVDAVLAAYDGVVEVRTWGERGLFYNPGERLPRGTYFLTLKDRDGPNDVASELDRPGVYRVSVPLAPHRYRERFGTPPSRPPKGGVVALAVDFTARDVLLPHPVYAWAGWACVLVPTWATWTSLEPVLGEAHALARERFDERVADAGP